MRIKLSAKYSVIIWALGLWLLSWALLGRDMTDVFHEEYPVAFKKLEAAYSHVRIQGVWHSYDQDKEGNEREKVG